MTATVAKPPLPTGVLDDFADKWLALRGGRVVASADTYDELMANPEVVPGDAVYHVPSSASLFY